MSDQIPDISLYAWCGENEEGEFGHTTVIMGGQPMAAVTTRFDLAMRMASQMQLRANFIGKPVHLLEFRATGAPDPHETLTPQQNPKES